MVFALEDGDFSGFGTSGARGNITDPWDRFSADRRAGILANNAESDVRAMQEAYDRRIDDVFKATGVRLENPALNKRLTRFHGRPEFVGGLAFGQFQKHLDNQLDYDGFDAELKRLSDQFPNFSDVIQPHLSPREQAKRIAFDAERHAQDLASRDKSWLGAAAGFAGGFAGGLEDPLMATTMFLGDPGGGRSLLTHAMRAAAINAGAETVLQPFVQAWRAEAGLPHGLGHAATNIAMAAAFGAALDAGGRSLYRGFRVYRGGKWIETNDAETSLDEAALRLPKDNPIRQAYEGDGKPLADILETSDDASTRDLAQRAADAGLFERYGVVDEWSHRENLAQAMRRAEAPDLEPVPGRVEADAPPARTPDLTDEAPSPGRKFDVEGRLVAYKQLSARNIGVDPATFQFKGDADAAGVTRRMSGVGEWDDLAAGKVFVYERADGSRVVADGHQRLGLAKRLIEDGKPAPKLDAYVFREADGWEPGEVRALAAKKNLQEGSGTVIDAAKIMRERPDIVDAALPMSSGMMRTARSLSRLAEDAFDAVVGGVVPANHASLVADLVPDAARHLSVIEELARLRPDNMDQARIAVGQINAVPAHTEVQMSLLGVETVTRSLMAERMRVLDAALKHLSADARVFATLNREASRIEAAGNRLAVDANARLADEAGQTRELVASLALSSGRVSDLLNEAAEAVANGSSARMAGETFARRVADVLEREGISGLAAASPAPRRPIDLFDEPAGDDATRQLEGLEQAREVRDAEIDGERDLFFALREKTAQDTFGFYSKALEAARALKQKKGTSEQMLAQLRKAGVKQAELDVTSLEAVMRGEKSVTKEEIIEHLELSRVEVMEGVYGNLTGDQAALEARMDELEAQFEAAEFGSAEYKRIDAEMQRYSDGLKGNEPKYSSYSLDPSNPTYKETVLHLPGKPLPNPEKFEVDAHNLIRETERLLPAGERPPNYWSLRERVDVLRDHADNNPGIKTALDEYDRLRDAEVETQKAIDGSPDFHQSHFSDVPNAIAHLRTSMQPDAQGRNNFVVNEFQSDWAQKIRDAQRLEAAQDLFDGSDYRNLDADGKAAVRKAIKDNPDKYKGVMDEGKIAELEKSVSELADQLRTLMEAEGFRSVRRSSGKYLLNTEMMLIPDMGSKGGANKLFDSYHLRMAELETARFFAPGHPLVNTEQYIITGLRRALRQAVEDGADYIAIASGETVDSFGMGAPIEGTLHFYNVKYPQELRDIIKKIDKDAGKPEKIDHLGKHDAPRGRLDLGNGFTRFALTDKLKQRIMAEGQPLFATRALDPDANRPTPRATADRAAIRKDIDKVIARLPDDVRFELQDRMVYRGQDVDGYFDATDNLVRVSLAAENPARIARHEEVHVYRQLGLLSDPEWGALVDHARANGLREKYDIDARYKELYGTKYKGDKARVEQVLDEEMVAEMWADYASGTRFGGAIDRIIAKVADVLRKVAAALRGRGYASVDDVFRRMESGEIGRRDALRVETKTAAADRAAGEVVGACRL